ncbi:MAG: chromate resistance protein ChrB domain-containing protein [Candidatus Omnitrophota bacterium]
MKRIIYFLLLLGVLARVGWAEDKHLYSTWDVLELDGCAAAWLIKNFVDPQAQFKFYPKGDFVDEGIAFDTPDANLRRTQSLSTFEAVLHEYKIKDAALQKMGSMIHEVEINFWSGNLDEATRKLNDKISAIVRQAKPPGEVLEESFAVFEELYHSLK